MDTATLVEAFMAQIGPLGERVGCLLVQLPPKLELDARLARRFFLVLRTHYRGAVALEPRHASWFTKEAQRLLERAHERARIPAWCIFDNATLGAGTANALGLLERLG